MAWPHPLTAHCIPTFSLSVTSALLHKRGQTCSPRAVLSSVHSAGRPPPPLLPFFPCSLQAPAPMPPPSGLWLLLSFSFITRITL